MLLTGESITVRYRFWKRMYPDKYNAYQIPLQQLSNLPHRHEGYKSKTFCNTDTRYVDRHNVSIYHAYEIRENTVLSKDNALYGRRQKTVYKSQRKTVAEKQTVCQYVRRFEDVCLCGRENDLSIL